MAHIDSAIPAVDFRRGVRTSVLATKLPALADPVGRVSRLVFASIAVASLMLAAARPVAAESPEAYRQLLRAAVDELGSGDSGAVADVAARLRAVDAVTMADGTTIHPDNSAVLAALDAQPPDLTAARSGLVARLLAVDLDFRAGPPVTEDLARNSLERVLARAEFQPEPPADPVIAFVRRIERAASDLIGHLLRLIFGGGEAGNPAAIVAPVIGVVVIVGLVVIVARGLRQSLGPSVAHGPTEAATLAQTAESARTEAVRLAQAGSFRAAMRLLYLSVMLRWDEQGLLHFDRSLTNREVLARVRAQNDGALVDRLTPLVDRFDWFWYGGARCTSDDYDAFARLVERAWATA